MQSFIFCMKNKNIFSGQLKIPPGIRMLSVEQEVEGDDTPVIDAVLASDAKRQQMIEKEKTLQAKLNRSVHVHCINTVRLEKEIYRRKSEFLGKFIMGSNVLY